MLIDNYFTFEKRNYLLTDIFIKIKAKSNFKNTVSCFNRLLGLPGNYPQLKDETKWISSKVSVNENNQILHEVSYQG